MKGVSTLAVILLILLFLTIASLSVLNWSERAVWSVVAALFAASVAIISQLASEEIGAQGSALLVFDEGSGLLLDADPSRASQTLSRAYAEMNYLAMLADYARDPADRTEENLRQDGRELLEVLLLFRMSSHSLSGIEMVDSPDSTGVPHFHRRGAATCTAAHSNNNAMAGAA